MDDLSQMIYYLGGFLIFLALSALFSSIHSAYFSLTQTHLSKFKSDHTKNSRRVIKLIAEPGKLFFMVLIGSTIARIGYVLFAALFLFTQYQTSSLWNIFLLILFFVLLILVCGEILPKVLVINHIQQYSLKVSIITEIIFVFFYPLSTGLERLTSLFKSLQWNRSFSLNKENKSFLTDENEKGFEEKEMIDSIAEFSETTVREIMVPRIDMMCAEINTPINKLIALIGEKGHTRIPVYQNRIDSIMGIIHAKDLIPFLAANQEKVSLKSLARPAYYVPESKKIGELLREFQKEKNHMAIVVDEYGGTAGLVTLEDILEEIVGEIQDEYDKEQPLYRKMNSNTFLVDGRISIEELNSVLPEPIPEEEAYETLGGLIFHITGNVPNKNDRIQFYVYDLFIEEVDQQRIKKVKVVKTEQPMDSESEETLPAP